jgi:hypothetical protein
VPVTREAVPCAKAEAAAASTKRKAMMSCGRRVLSMFWLLSEALVVLASEEFDERFPRPKNFRRKIDGRRPGEPRPRGFQTFGVYTKT